MHNFNHTDNIFKCSHCKSNLHLDEKHKFCPICKHQIEPEPIDKESDSNNNFYNFIVFRRMITPIIIQILFWIGVVTSVVGGLIIIFSGNFTTLIGLAVLIFGPVVSRIICEFLILFFRINETLTDISNTQKSRSD